MAGKSGQITNLSTGEVMPDDWLPTIDSVMDDTSEPYTEEQLKLVWTTALCMDNSGSTLRRAYYIIIRRLLATVATLQYTMKATDVLKTLHSGGILDDEDVQFLLQSIHRFEVGRKTAAQKAEEGKSP